MQVWKLIAGAMVLFLAPMATAATITITFGTSGGTAGFTGTGNPVGPVNLGFLGATGLTLAVYPHSTVNSGTSATSWLVTSNSSGYGVDNSAGFADGTDNTGDIDNSGGRDTLQLIFNDLVLLTSVTFGNWDSNDEADFHSGSIFGANTHIAFYSSSGSTWNLPDTLASGFFFRAGDGFGLDNDDFRVRSITFDYTPIPEPATYMLTGIGLVGLGLIARRRLLSK